MTICTDCALCCDGTLFAYVDIGGDERERMARLGVPLDERTGKFILKHSCRCLASKKCRIYADRPRKCSEYRCELLKSVERGDIEPIQALAIIADTRKAADEVTAELAPGETPASRIGVLDRSGEVPGAAPLAPGTIAKMIKLNLMLDRYFRSERKRLFREPARRIADGPNEADVPTA